MKWVKKNIGYWCQDILEGGYTGQGVGVAVLDTGITLHPDFGSRIVDFIDCVNHKKMIYDDSGHGTHVAGILAGSGRLSNGAFAGIAPGAELFVGKVLDRFGNGSVEYVLNGIRWILFRKGESRIRIVNISVGTQPGLSRREELRLLEGVEQLWDAGLVVVVSAGNYGPKRGTVAVPGSSPKVITVGAVDNLSQANYKNWNYSGRGPTQSCVVKPDVVAPGTGIQSCNGEYVNRYKNPYIKKSGTSMAAPIVSGAVACLLSKYPDMTNVEVKLKLRESCIFTGDEEQGWGVLNVRRLLAP